MDKYKYRKYVYLYGYVDILIQSRYYIFQRSNIHERNTRPIWVILSYKKNNRTVWAHISYEPIFQFYRVAFMMVLYLCGIIVQWRSMRAKFEWVELVNCWLYARQHRVVFLLHRIRIVRTFNTVCISFSHLTSTTQYVHWPCDFFSLMSLVA